MEDETPLGEEIDGGNDNICTGCGGNGECTCDIDFSIDPDDCDYDDEDCICPDDGRNDDMDGDAQSALASAGWGTDEDYGCCDDDGDY